MWEYLNLEARRTRLLALLSILLIFSSAASAATAFDVFSGDLNMHGNNITGFFGAACPGDDYVTNVYPNGTFQCSTDDTAASSDNQNLSQVLVHGNQANTSIDMVGNNIVNVDTLGNGTAGTIELSFSGDLVIPSGSLNISNGDLNLNGNLNFSQNSQILQFFGSGCSGGEVVRDVADDGTFTCTSVDGAGANTYVNETGDSMSGNLNMSFTGNITGVAELQNFFDGACSGDDYVTNVYPNGTFQCGTDDGVTSVGDPWVNESGDTMTGALHATAIDLVTALEAGNISLGDGLADTGTDGDIDVLAEDSTLSVTGTGVDIASGAITGIELSGDPFVNESGDTLSGNLDMGANAIKNIGSLSVSTALAAGNISLGDGLADTGSDGDIDVQTADSTLSVTASGVGVAQGGITGVELAGDSFVNETGDTMTGNLDFSHTANATNLRQVNLTRNDGALPACDGGRQGAIMYNGSHWGCDGTSWNKFY